MLIFVPITEGQGENLNLSVDDSTRICFLAALSSLFPLFPYTLSPCGIKQTSCSSILYFYHLECPSRKPSPTKKSQNLDLLDKVGSPVYFKMSWYGQGNSKL